MSDTINILNKADTLKKIASIKGREGTLTEAIQSAVIGGLSHAAEHGDSGLLAKLVAAVSKPNATQLRKFITAHAPLKWNGKDGKFTKVKNGGMFRVADALEQDWSTFEKAAAVPAAFDADKELAKARKALETAALKAADADDAGTANRLIEAYKALDAVQSETVLKVA